MNQSLKQIPRLFLVGLMVFVGKNAKADLDSESIQELFTEAAAFPSEKYLDHFQIGTSGGFEPGKRDSKEQILADYIFKRDFLVAEKEDVKPFLKKTIQSTKSWKERTTAQILLGWMKYPTLYAELWDWQPPRSRKRNPYPDERRAAREKFESIGKKAIPIMLELSWKRGQTHHGTLLVLLCEWDVPSALPVITESISHYGVNDRQMLGPALTRYGEAASAYILESLKTTPRYHSEYLLTLLGYTGGKNAIAYLSRQAIESPYPEDREEAIKSLGRLKRFGDIRTLLVKMKPADRANLLEVLAPDDSAETRKFLYTYAISGNTKEERFEAVKTLLKMVDDKEISKLCAIIAKEPEDYTRSNMYLYLGLRKHPDSREAFLQALQDRSEWVQIRAIEGLMSYKDEQITKAIIPYLQGKPRVKRSALFALKERQSPLIADTVLELLGDEDVEIVRWTAQALVKNPTPKAVSSMINMLRSSEPAHRYEAARVLAAIGDARALAPLREALKQEKADWVQSAMKSAITKLSDK